MPELDEKFMSNIRVNRASGCWEWQAGTNNHGYGCFWRDGRSWFAHRWALGSLEPLMPGLIVMHVCDNPRCANPKHLRQGTRKENTQDMIRKRRDGHGTCGRRQRLTDAQARDVQQARREGTTLRALAEHYGVGTSTIHRAARRTFA